MIPSRMDIRPMVTMITEMIGSPIKPAQKDPLHAHGQEEGDHQAGQKGQQNRHPWPRP